MHLYSSCSPSTIKPVCSSVARASYCRSRSHRFESPCVLYVAWDKSIYRMEEINNDIVKQHSVGAASNSILASHGPVHKLTTQRMCKGEELSGESEILLELEAAR